MCFVDFDYGFWYKICSDLLLNIQIYVILMVFDRECFFLELVFQFFCECEFLRFLSELYFMDYDLVFWNCMKEYRLSVDRLKMDLFYNDFFMFINDYIFYFEKYWLGIIVRGGFYQYWNVDKWIYLCDMGIDIFVMVVQGGILVQ